MSTTLWASNDQLDGNLAVCLHCGMCCQTLCSVVYCIGWRWYDTSFDMMFGTRFFSCDCDCLIIDGNRDDVHLKIMVPSCAAGAVIGKGGETIGRLQRETTAKIKMSKNQDTFPGKYSLLMSCTVIPGHAILVCLCRYFGASVSDCG